MNPIALVVVTVMLLDLVMHVVAGMLNLKGGQEMLPGAFRGLLEHGQYEKSWAYLKAKTRLAWIANAFDLSLLMLFWFCSGFGRLDGWVRSLGLTSVTSGIVYIGVLLAIKALLSMPFGVYLTFVVEQRFGLNGTSWPTYLADRFKSLLLVAGLGTPLLATVLALFNYADANAWWYCWLAVTGFMLLVQYVAPVWIMPLFNRFDPLEQGVLRQAIIAYATKIDFNVENIFIMDGSRRSTKSNAFFTGFGRHRRIVLYDTLVEAFCVEELIAVLAHEMGHYKMHHVGRMTVVNILQTGLMFFLLSLAIGCRPLFEAFYVHQFSIYTGLILFSILYAPLEGWLAIAVNALSRHHEFAADRFSVETTNKKHTMQAVLKKLSLHNLSWLQPHPLYVFLYYSHPPVLKRVEAIEKIDLKQPAPKQNS